MSFIQLQQRTGMSDSELELLAVTQLNMSPSDFRFALAMERKEIDGDVVFLEKEKPPKKHLNHNQMTHANRFGKAPSRARVRQLRDAGEWDNYKEKYRYRKSLEEYRKKVDELINRDRSEYKTFSENWYETSAELNAIPSYREWERGLSKAELENVTKYTGFEYIEVNRALRAGQPKNDSEFSTDIAVAAISRGSMHDDMTLTRFLTTNEKLLTQWGKLQPGDVWTDKAFQSTTFKDIDTDNPTRIVMKIHAPKGTVGASVNGISQHSVECEFVLPPDTALYVHNKYKSEAGVRYIEATVLPKKPTPPLIGKHYPGRHDQSSHGHGGGLNATIEKPLTDYKVYEGVAASEETEIILDSLQESYMEWRSGLTEEQVRAIKTYTGNDYREINDGLRNNDLPMWQKENVRLIDEALSKGEAVEDMIVKRTVGKPGSPSAQFFGKIQAGEVFTDKAYFSTSVIEPLDPYKAGVVMNIRVTKGTPGGYLGYSGLTNYIDESEFLLPRDSHFYVNSKETNDRGQIVLDLTVLPITANTKNAPHSKHLAGRHDQARHTTHRARRVSVQKEINLRKKTFQEAYSRMKGIRANVKKEVDELRELDRDRAILKKKLRSNPNPDTRKELETNLEETESKLRERLEVDSLEDGQGDSYVEYLIDNHERTLEDDALSKINEMEDDLHLGATTAILEIANLTQEKIAKESKLLAEARKLNKLERNMIEAGGDLQESPYKEQRVALLGEMTDLRKEYDQKVAEALSVDDPISFRANGDKNPRITDGLGAFSNLVDRDLIEGRDLAVNIAVQESTRANYSSVLKKVTLDTFSSTGSVVHEMGHWLEDNSYFVASQADSFLAERTKGEVAVHLGAGYGLDEVARRDHFISPYMGKVYDAGATEIVSMGLQMFHEDPIGLALGDREYFEFVFNTVRGIK